MSKINKLCIKVLEFTKKHNMKISTDDFQKICGKHTDAVFAELHDNKIGTYVTGYKSIWSVRTDELESALLHYKSIERGKTNSLLKWIIGLIISAAGAVTAFLSIL